jgi:hypothetical protein
MANTTTIVLTTSNNGTSWFVPDDWNNQYNTIYLWGAGGGGAGSFDETVSGYQLEATGGSGGGGGGFTKLQNLKLVPKQQVTFTVGVGGYAGASIGYIGGGNANGGDGGNTLFFYSTYKAGGGQGGRSIIPVNYTIGAANSTPGGLGGYGASYSGGNGGASGLALLFGHTGAGGGGGAAGALGPGGYGGNGNTASGLQVGGGGGGASGGSNGYDAESVKVGVGGVGGTSGPNTINILYSYYPGGSNGTSGLYGSGGAGGGLVYGGGIGSSDLEIANTFGSGSGGGGGGLTANSAGWGGFPGGGGGGAAFIDASTINIAGNGANGLIVIQYVPVVSQNSYVFSSTTPNTIWTVPDDWNATGSKIELFGGGGGGTGVIDLQNSTSPVYSSQIKASNGGGGGGYLRINNLNLLPGQNVQITIGSGGRGGNGLYISPTVGSVYTQSNLSSNGAAGGNTSILFRKTFGYEGNSAFTARGANSANIYATNTTIGSVFSITGSGGNYDYSLSSSYSETATITGNFGGNGGVGLLTTTIGSNWIALGGSGGGGAGNFYGQGSNGASATLAANGAIGGGSGNLVQTQNSYSFGPGSGGNADSPGYNGFDIAFTSVGAGGGGGGANAYTNTAGYGGYAGGGGGGAGSNGTSGLPGNFYGANGSNGLVAISYTNTPAPQIITLTSGNSIILPNDMTSYNEIHLIGGGGGGSGNLTYYGPANTYVSLANSIIGWQIINTTANAAARNELATTYGQFGSAFPSSITIPWGWTYPTSQTGSASRQTVYLNQQGAVSPGSNVSSYTYGAFSNAFLFGSQYYSTTGNLYWANYTYSSGKVANYGIFGTTPNRTYEVLWQQVNGYNQTNSGQYSFQNFYVRFFENDPSRVEFIIPLVSQSLSECLGWWFAGTSPATGTNIISGSASSENYGAVANNTSFTLIGLRDTQAKIWTNGTNDGLGIAGAGGGGGGYTRLFNVPLFPNSLISYNIGNTGAGGLSYNFANGSTVSITGIISANGSPGGNTTFLSNTYSANGGAGGILAAANVGLNGSPPIVVAYSGGIGGTGSNSSGGNGNTNLIVSSTYGTKMQSYSNVSPIIMGGGGGGGAGGQNGPGANGAPGSYANGSSYNTTVAWGTNFPNAVYGGGGGASSGGTAANTFNGGNSYFVLNGGGDANTSGGSIVANAINGIQGGGGAGGWQGPGGSGSYYTREITFAGAGSGSGGGGAGNNLVGTIYAGGPGGTYGGGGGGNDLVGLPTISNTAGYLTTEGSGLQAANGAQGVIIIKYWQTPPNTINPTNLTTAGGAGMFMLF